MVTELNGCWFGSSRAPDGSTLVSISGELDSVNAVELARLLGNIAAEGDVTLDLEQVRFIDSRGLGALVHAARTARDAGHSLRVVSLSPRVSKVFEIAGVAEVLPFDQSAG